MTSAVAHLAAPPPAPLFRWRAEAEAARLASIRQDLHARIERLPPRSFRRVVLEARLADITARQLAIETSLAIPDDLP